MGIIVLILGIRMIGEGIYNYIDEHNQKTEFPQLLMLLIYQVSIRVLIIIAMLIMILPINTK